VTLFDQISAASLPEALAVVSTEGRIDLRDLLERAITLSTVLTQYPGSVLIYGHKEPAMVVGILALIELAEPTCRSNPSTPIERASRMIAVARPVIVIATRTLAG